MHVTIDEALHGIVRAGVMRLSHIALPADGGEALWQALLIAVDGIFEQWCHLMVGQVPGVEEARRLYRRVGLDPTKTRPSSEALLRRAIKGKGLYRIHPLVDLLNLVSLSELIPVGLYDESKIIGGTVTIRLGGPGAGFDGIRKDRVHVEGRLCVADDAGPFGSPTSDSLRTSIKGPVAAVLVIFFQPSDGNAARLEQALDRTAVLAAHHVGASLEMRMAISR